MDAADKRLIFVLRKCWAEHPELKRAADRIEKLNLLLDDAEAALSDMEAAAEHERIALSVAINALMKISQPRVGGGQWAADVATEALNGLTCAGSRATV